MSKALAVDSFPLSHLGHPIISPLIDEKGELDGEVTSSNSWSPGEESSDWPLDQLSSQVRLSASHLPPLTPSVGSGGPSQEHVHVTGTTFIPFPVEEVSHQGLEN